MSVPAYQGEEFPLSIHTGTRWRHEFKVIDRDSPGGIPSEGWAAGLSAVMTISDDSGQVLATLSSTPGANGTITFGDPALGHDVIACELPAEFTATLPPTDNASGHQVKAFVYASLRLTDPSHPSEPYPFAYAKGVITRF